MTSNHENLVAGEFFVLKPQGQKKKKTVSVILPALYSDAVPNKSNSDPVLDPTGAIC